MANPRPTFQQRLFSDEELPLPIHDQIVRWTDVTLKEKIHIILRCLGIPHFVDESGISRGWNKFTFYSGFSDYDRPLHEASLDYVRRKRTKYPPPPPIRALGITWEPMLKDSRQVLLGAIDLRARIRVMTPEIKLVTKGAYAIAPDNLTWAKSLIETSKGFGCADRENVWMNGEEHPIAIKPEIPDGFIGAIWSQSSAHLIESLGWASHESWYEDIEVYIEAKTKIRSAGELLRQINLYKTTTSRSTRFIVVAPAEAWDPEVRTILEEQMVVPLNYMSN